MDDAAVGYRPHSGWAAFVILSLQEGKPLVLSRKRVQLVEAFTYEFRQPFHTAEKLPLAQGRRFVSRVRSEAQRLADRAIRSAQENASEGGRRLNRCGLLLASGRPLPSFEEILASHALIHAADGELFREALAHASSRLGFSVLRVKEKELLTHAAQSLRLTETALLQRVTELGRPLGSPWSSDEKFGAIVAWLALMNGRRSDRSI